MIGRFITAFVYSMISLAILLGGMYVYKSIGNQWRNVPLIPELTDAYQRGWRNSQIIGAAIFREIVQQSEYHPTGGEPTQQITDTRKQDLQFQLSWQRDEVVEKLRRKGFNKKRLRLADRYLDYVELYMVDALQDMYHTKVSASITLAQGILESNAGDSKLALTTNNHFGIKARQKASAREKIKQKRYHEIVDADFMAVQPGIGVSRHHDDHKYDRFEIYPTVLHSFRRHSNLLTNYCTSIRKGCYVWIWDAFPVGKEKVDIRSMAAAYEAVSGMAPEDYFGDTKLSYFAAQAAGLKMAGYATSPTYHEKIAYLIETYDLWKLDMDLVRAQSQW